MSIGFLVVALIAGGFTSSRQLTTSQTPVSTIVEADIAEPEPGLRVVANQLIDSVSLLAEGVQHSTEGLIPINAVDEAWVTHYGESFNGQQLGCDTGPYSSEDASIVAVGPSRYSEWPCGTLLRVCGPGSCIVAQRVDGCPGCGPNHIDLSEQGLSLVCGPGTGVCKASIEAFTLICDFPPPRSTATQVGPVELFVTLAETALGDRTADMLDLAQDEPRGDVCTASGSPDRTPIWFE